MKLREAIGQIDDYTETQSRHDLEGRNAGQCSVQPVLDGRPAAIISTSSY